MSADWDLRKLQLSLDKKGPSAVYFLHGEEIFLLDEALRAIKSRVLVEGAQDFNYDSFMAPETNSGQVRDAVETLPVICERRLVIYKNVESIKDDAWDELLPVIESPFDTATLVLVANKVDKRKKFVKRLLASKTVFVELKKPYDNQIPTWIDYIAFLNDVQISPEGIAAIQELVGTNLSEINNEVKKIRQYLSSTAGASKSSKIKIGLEDVLKVVTVRMPDVMNSVMLSQVMYVLPSEKAGGENKYGIQFEQIEFDIKRKIRNFVASGGGKTSA